MARGRKKTIKTADEMKRANGTGCIRKLSGNRRKPYQVMITTKYERDEKTGRTKQVVKQLGTYETRELAEQALNEYNDSPYNFETATITFGELYEIWSNKKFKKLSKSTIQSYSSAFNYCDSIKDICIKNLKTMHLQEVVDNCPHGSNTKSNIKVIMSAVFEYAEMNDIVSKNYAKFIEIEESEPTFEREVFTIEEIGKLFEMKDDCYVKIVLILLYTGMRVNELLLMRRECCSLEEKSLYVEKAKNKSSIRKVPIHDEIYCIVKEFYNKNGELLITNDNGFAVPYNNFATRQFKRMMEKIGAEHRIHDARHTFVSRAKECNLDDLCVKRIIGHTTKDVTSKVYTHITHETLLKEINKLNY